MHIEKILHTKTIYKIIEKPILVESTTKQSDLVVSRPPTGMVTDKGTEPGTEEGPDEEDNRSGTAQEPMNALSGPKPLKGQQNSGSDQRAAAGFGYEQPSKHREHELKGTYGLNYGSRGPVVGGANDDHVAAKRKPGGGDRYHGGTVNRGIPRKKYGSYKHAVMEAVQRQVRPGLVNGLGHHRTGGESHHHKYRVSPSHSGHYGDVLYVGDHVPPEYLVDVGAAGHNGGFGHGRPVGGTAYRGQNGYSLLYTHNHHHHHHPVSYSPVAAAARPTAHDDPHGIFGRPAARKPLYGLVTGSNDGGGENVSNDGGAAENYGGGDVKGGGDGGYLVRENVAETKQNVTAKVPAPVRSNGSVEAVSGSGVRRDPPEGTPTGVVVTATPKIVAPLPPQIVRNVYYTLDPVVPYDENKVTAIPVTRTPEPRK